MSSCKLTHLFTELSKFSEQKQKKELKEGLLSLTSDLRRCMYMCRAMFVSIHIKLYICIHIFIIYFPSSDTLLHVWDIYTLMD